MHTIIFFQRTNYGIEMESPKLLSPGGKVYAKDFYLYSGSIKTYIGQSTV